MSLLLIEQAVQLSQKLKRQVEIEDWAAASDTEAMLVSCFNTIKSDEEGAELMDFEKLNTWFQTNKVLVETVEGKKEEAQTALLQLKNARKGVNAYRKNS